MRIWNATVEFLILENKRNYYNLSIWKCKEEMVTGKWLDYRYQMKDNERCQMNRTMWNWRNWRKLQKYSLGRWSWWIGDNCKSGFTERNNRIKMVCNLLKYSAERSKNWNGKYCPLFRFLHPFYICGLRLLESTFNRVVIH